MCGNTELETMETMETEEGEEMEEDENEEKEEEEECVFEILLSPIHSEKSISSK